MLFIVLQLKNENDRDFTLYLNSLDPYDIEVLIRNECWDELFKYCYDYKHLWYTDYLIYKLTR